jgi:hypothetical protein
MRTCEQDEFICDVPGKLVTHNAVNHLAGVSPTYLAETDANFSLDAADACFNVSHSFT